MKESDWLTADQWETMFRWYQPRSGTVSHRSCDQ